jgi:hypothetical protein
VQSANVSSWFIILEGVLFSKFDKEECLLPEDCVKQSNKKILQKVLTV